METQENIFEFYPAQGELIGFLSIPHSGERLPEVFKPYLSSNIKDLMQDVDFRVHELIDLDQIQSAGISILKSNIIRTAIDLNRSPDKTLLNWKKNSKGIEIVKSTPDANSSAKLIAMYYSPYFEMIKSNIDALAQKTQNPSVIDLHSMPSEATDYHMAINPIQEKQRPDFCLSDISGISCQKDFIDFPCMELEKAYSRVTQNNPYFGGHITRFIHEKYPNVNNIQIEISRAIYMDESSQTLIHEKIKKLKPVLTNAIINTFKQFAPN